MPNDRMMVTKAKIDRIGGAIREQLGESDTYTLDEMPDKIRAISGGSGTITPLNVTENGIYTAEAGNGYSPVTVNVASGSVGDVTNFSVTNAGNIATVSWTDPVDTASVTWASTVIVIKYGAVPQNPTDGDVIVTEKTRDQYSVNGFQYQFLKGEKCYFRAFTYSTIGGMTAGSSAYVEATLEIVSWASGTDQQIVDMINAADEGLIDLYEDGGWRAGDERVISIGSIPKVTYNYYSSESNNPDRVVDFDEQGAQNITLVLANRGGKTLVNPVKSGRTTCSFITLMKYCLNIDEPFHHYLPLDEDIDASARPYGWANSDMKNWCNSVFLQAMPNTLPIFKPVINTSIHTLDNNPTEYTDTTNDTFFIPSESEVKGENAWTYHNIPSDRNNSELSRPTYVWFRSRSRGQHGNISWVRCYYYSINCQNVGSGTTDGNICSNKCGVFLAACI